MNSTELVRKNKLEGFYKILFSIAIPIILQNLLQTFVNMMDTVMVGRIGAVEIAAVGLGNQIFFILNMVVFGISSGCSIFIAQYWGQQDLKGIRKTFGIMLIVCTGVALLFTIAGVFFPEALISLYTNDAQVISEATDYLKIVALSYPIMAVSFACQAAFRSTEHVILPMVTTAISFVLNVTGNAIFIFGFEPLGIPRMGVAGAALATFISRAVEFFITIVVGKVKKYEAFGSLKELMAFNEKSFLLRLLKVGLPVIFSETMWGLGISTQNSIFAHTGTDSFAAFSITNTVSQLTWVIFIGMGNAAAIILGKKIGSGDKNGAIAYTNRYCWFFPLLGLIIGLFLIPLSFLVPYIFNIDENIVQIVKTMLYAIMCLYPFRAFNMLLIVGICRSGGDTIFASLIDNGWMWLVAIPLGYIASFKLGLAPWQILLCLEVEQLLKTTCGIFRVRSGKWLHNVTN